MALPPSTSWTRGWIRSCSRSRFCHKTCPINTKCISNTCKSADLLLFCRANCTYKGVSKSLWTGHLGQELQMVQLSATRCSSIAIMWISLVSFSAITLCVASQQVFIVVISLSTQSGNFWIHPCMHMLQHFLTLFQLLFQLSHYFIISLTVVY
jgi:hypothetical protein